MNRNAPRSIVSAVHHTGENARGCGAIVVLGAGSDAGADLARRLLEAGHRVLLVDRQATAMVRSMHGYPHDRVAAVAADVGDPRQLRAVLDRARAWFGRVDDVLTVGGGRGLPIAS